MNRCQGCGKLFAPTKGAGIARQFYCDRKCRHRTYRKLRREAHDYWTLPPDDASHSICRSGYVYITVGGLKVPEHRYVMQRTLKRALRRGESVHHKDGNRANNDPGNLELWVTSPRYGQRASDLTCPHCGKAYL